MTNLSQVKVVTVSVDYEEELRLSLQANRKVFQSDYLVVTALDNTRTVEICQEFGVSVLQTNAFYENRSVFNKWAGLEKGLDHIGRYGWIAILDSDIVFPQSADISLDSAFLYTPQRKILQDFNAGVPPESEWGLLPGIGHYEGFPGYAQIFHADAAPKTTPWHRTDLGHAGCADTWFEEHWPRENHAHPNFEVVHLGTPFQNWVGKRLTEAQRKVLIKRAYKAQRIQL